MEKTFAQAVFKSVEPAIFVFREPLSILLYRW